MDTQTWIAVLTLLAIASTPFTSIWITRTIDHRRERRERRMDIFRQLMRTRRTPITPEHVGALNLIEIEFAGDLDIIAA